MWLPKTIHDMTLEEPLTKITHLYLLSISHFIYILADS